MMVMLMISMASPVMIINFCSLFMHYCSVLIAAVNKSTTSLPLVFFNNCLDNGYSNSKHNKMKQTTYNNYGVV